MFFDRGKEGRRQEFWNALSRIEAEVTHVNETTREMKSEVDTIQEKLFTGNGQESLMVQVAGLRSSVRGIRWAIGIGASLMVAVIGALELQIVNFNGGG